MDTFGLKKTTMIAAFLLFATGGAAYQSATSSKQKPCVDDCAQPCEVQCPVPDHTPQIAAYNAPCYLEPACQWNLYTDISFIYWQPIQENMEMGGVSGNDISDVNPTQNMDFDYFPGFKLLFGGMLNFDNLDAWVEYTWLHGVDKSVATFDARFISPVQFFPQAQTPSCSRLEKKWTFKLDTIDFLMGREYYSGQKLTLHSFYGARVALIRQKFDADFILSEIVNATPGWGHLYQTSQSWGIGLRTGTNANLNLGKGFRLIGNGSGDILYTRYTFLKDTSLLVTFGDGEFSSSTAEFQQSDIDYLRVHLDLESGFGWGRYFSKNKWHLDLSATYNYQVFFAQNMFRFFVAAGSSAAPNGDLFIHGLNLTAKASF